MRRVTGAADERGSLIVALAVMLVLTTLSVALLARTTSAVTSARRGQDNSSALAAAAAGLNDALFTLDQVALGTSLPAAVPASGWQTKALPNAASFSWQATLSGSTYTVVSVGTAQRSTHSLGATAIRQPQYPFALFADHGISFNGGSGQIFAGPPGGPADPLRQARIGSNHAIVLASGTGGGNAQVPYPPAGSCSGCPNPQPATTGPFATPDPAVPPGVTPAPCPYGGNDNGQPLVSGVYACTGDLTLTGAVTVSATPANPVRIYMFNGSPAGSGPPSTLHLANVSIVASDATDLIIDKAGAGTVDVGGPTDQVAFTGILYAPGASLTSPGCKLTLAGALSLDTFTCSGEADLFSLAYPSSVEALTAGWVLSNQHEVPTP